MSESLPRRIYKWLRGGYHDVRGTVPFKIVGYWNGVCPRCGTHIGIDVRVNLLNQRESAVCAYCGEEIWDLIRGDVDLYFPE